jgi:hypothetical protein
LALTFAKQVIGISNIILTQKDVEKAKSAHGGMGKDTQVPRLEGSQFSFWVRGRTGMCGTNFYHHIVTFPSATDDVTEGDDFVSPSLCSKETMPSNASTLPLSKFSINNINQNDFENSEEEEEEEEEEDFSCLT